MNEAFPNVYHPGPCFGIKKLNRKPTLQVKTPNSETADPHPITFEMQNTQSEALTRRRHFPIRIQTHQQAQTFGDV